MYTFSSSSSIIKFPSKTISCMGDSLTHAVTLGVPPEKLWPSLLASKLNSRFSCNCQARNFGKSGDTTAATAYNMQYRFRRMVRHEIPTIGIIWAGANDPTAISNATTQNNIQCMIKWLKFGCIGQVAAQTSLPVNGSQGDRYVVQVDSSGTGGVTETIGQTRTIPGQGNNAQTVWEFRNPQAGAAGWGRIATAATPADKCTRIIINSMQYLNWSVNGDNYNTVAGTGTKYTTYDDVTGVRLAQKNAVTAEATNNTGVVYNDLYTYMGNLIYSSAVDSQGSFSWHYADGNQHFNWYGNDVISNSLLAKIQSQDGWIAALS